MQITEKTDRTSLNNNNNSNNITTNSQKASTSQRDYSHSPEHSPRESNTNAIAQGNITFPSEPSSDPLDSANYDSNHASITRQEVFKLQNFIIELTNQVKKQNENFTNLQNKDDDLRKLSDESAQKTATINQLKEQCTILSNQLQQHIETAKKFQKQIEEISSNVTSKENKIHGLTRYLKTPKEDFPDWSYFSWDV